MDLETNHRVIICACILAVGAEFFITDIWHRKKFKKALLSSREYVIAIGVIIFGVATVTGFLVV